MLQTHGVEPRIRTPHGELTPEELAEALPGTGDLMALVGDCWWKCAHAARGGNWDLAAYFARRIRGLQRRLALVRPKYREDIERFEHDSLEPVLMAAGRADLAAFRAAFDAATDAANALHAKWGKSYIRWVLNEDPPKDLDLSG
jgi:hypothetical protein